MLNRANNRILLNSNFWLLFLFILIKSDGFGVEARDKGGDDIILTKGKIIMRGGKGKGNIILDPGSGNEGGHHEMMMPPMMFNPYAFYPMQHHHSQPMQAPQIMIKPVYVEDHSAMRLHEEKQQEQQNYEQPKHKQEMEQQQHQYESHQVEPQHHQEVEHQQPEYQPMQHEQENHEMEEQMGHYQEQPMHHEHEQENHGGHYEQDASSQQEHQHPLMSLMMHGSGNQPIYQHQLAAMHAMQSHPMNAQAGAIDQQAAAYHQAQIAAQMAAAQQQMNQHQQMQHQQDQQEIQDPRGELKEASSQQSSAQNNAPAQMPDNASGTRVPQVGSEVSQQRPKFSLLEKSANNPLVKMIKPLFRRHKDQKETSVKEQKSNSN